MLDNCVSVLQITCMYAGGQLSRVCKRACVSACGHMCVLQDLSSTDNVLDVVFFFDDKIECRCA